YRNPTKFVAADTGYQIEELETQLHTILINSYIEYYVIPKVSIYATLGIGAAITQARAYNVVNIRKLGQSPSFAVQVGFGAGYNITEHLILDLTFRYIDALNYTTSRAKFPLSGIELLGGVRYTF
ncbi:MAG: outer membrane beta-barrel protein, partial [Desulfovibrionaceae bacterium]|nr:outer membrane beta-barrel protein [Desulfovibrionaceae bacterium]